MGNYKNGIETKTALYNSARSCFYEKGYFDTSIRDIVEKAHSRLGLFSYHFESKEAAAVMVFREYIANVSTTIRRALGSIFDESDLLLNDMLNYRGYFTGLLRNENISRFYVELTTTECYLDQNFRYKEYFFQRLCSPQLVLNKCWRNEGMGNLFVSLTAGMEIQMCRDYRNGRIRVPLDDALDAYFDTYYSLLVQSRRQVEKYVRQTREIMDTIDWAVGPGFEPYIIRRREDITPGGETPEAST